MHKTTVLEYDDLLMTVGEFGPLQVFVICYNAFLFMYSAINILDIVFILAVPDHICAGQFNNLSRASPHNGYTEFDDVNNLLIPLEDYEGKTRYSQCVHFLFNSTVPELQFDNLTGFSNSSHLPTAECSNWEFDTSQISSSLVTQVNILFNHNLVCWLCFKYKNIDHISCPTNLLNLYGLTSIIKLT